MYFQNFSSFKTFHLICIGKSKQQTKQIRNCRIILDMLFCRSGILLKLAYSLTMARKAGRLEIWRRKEKEYFADKGWMILRLLSSPHVIPPHIALRGRFCNAQYFYFFWAKIPIYVYHLFSSSLFSPCHQKAVWKIRRTLILLTIFFGRTIESWRLNFLGELYHLGKTNKSYCLQFFGRTNWSLLGSFFLSRTSWSCLIICHNSSGSKFGNCHGGQPVGTYLSDLENLFLSFENHRYSKQAQKGLSLNTDPV